jgi:outer membrane protein OmpA-like peptidoglycan-associated protein/outer membrane protein W
MNIICHFESVFAAGRNALPRSFELLLSEVCALPLTSTFVSLTLWSMMIMATFPANTAAQTEGETFALIGVGPTLSVAETPAADRAVNLGVRLSVLHAVSSRVAFEFGAGVFNYSSVNRERSSDFSTSSVPIDLRLRWSFAKPGSKVRPFVFAGLGYQNYSYDSQVLQRSAWRQILNDNPNAVREGVVADSAGSSSWYNPIGVGMRLALTGRTHLEFSFTACPAWNDDLHPLRDGKHDGWMSGMISLSYMLNDEPSATQSIASREQPLTASASSSSSSASTAAKDTDGDGLSDDLERSSTMTDPLRADTDGDGLRDGDEVLKYRTDALRTDTDGDAVSDGDEVLKYRTNPNERDSDAGGTADGVEIFLAHTNPLDAADDVAANAAATRKEQPINKPAQPSENAIDTLQSDSADRELPSIKEADTSADSGSDTSSAVKSEAKSNSPSTSPQAAPKSTRIVFAGITFANNQADVLPASRAALDSAYAFLANNPELNVEIQGYASKSRSAVQREDLAVDLSKRRAKSVMDYLVYKGISKKRMSVAGYGTQRPVDTENPYSEQNRRIEFLVK